MTDFAIETSGLRKSFKGQAAMAGLTFAVPKGSIYGFLGRNGAGKTTTIRVLMGLAKADAGSARVLGLFPDGSEAGANLRRRIGYVTEDKELYPYMTVDEIIRFTRPFFPSWRGDLEQRYLKVFDLPLKKKIRDLSKGMRSKLMLLLALSRGAELLILDEPTDGLDPAAVEDVLREVVALSAFLFAVTVAMAMWASMGPLSSMKASAISGKLIEEVFVVFNVSMFGAIMLAGAGICPMHFTAFPWITS